MSSFEDKNRLTTFSLFGYKDLSKIWAFLHMGRGPYLFNKVPGLIFYKLLGSGAGLGFSLKPDFGRYGFMAVWEQESCFLNFLQSDIYKSYLKHSYEQYHIKLCPFYSKGTWSGKNPFVYESNIVSPEEPIVVLTRASIYPGKIREFWKYVPQTSESLKEAKGLIASIGVGEAPVYKQATLSIWKDQEAIKNYAYKMQSHKEVVQLTRMRNWYKEELFARFTIIDSSGTWNGKNPLEKIQTGNL
ncbi:MAG: spheroidene monooxygenase [Cytophagaceae bacterium]